MKRKLKPSKLNPHLVLERIGKFRGLNFSIIFTDFGHRCAYIKPSKNNLIWLFYTLRTISSKKYFDIRDKYDYDLVPTVHGGIGYISFDKNHDRGFTDGLVIGWDYGHLNDAKDHELVEKYFGEECTRIGKQFMNFKDIQVIKYTQEDILRDIKITIENIFYVDEKYPKLKKELQRMIFKPFLKKRKYKNK